MKSIEATGDASSVFTITREVGERDFEFDSSLSTSFQLPYPSEILYASKRAAYNVLLEFVLLEFGGNEDSDDPLDSLDVLFEDSNAEIQLQILQRCFTASGSRFSKIVQKTVGDTEAQILATAKNDPSAGRRWLEEIGRELESREKDGHTT